MSIPQKTYSAIIPAGEEGNDSLKPKSHRFTAASDELAEELCLAMDWKFIGEVPAVVTEDQKKRAASAPRSRVGSNPLLSADQIRALAITARQAFGFQDELGLVEETGKNKTERFNKWRKAIQRRIAGQESLTMCRNNDFRPLKAEFLKLAGKPFEDPKSNFRGKQSEREEDTAERRERLLDLICQALAAHHENGGEISEAYALTIWNRKNSARKLSNLDDLIAHPASLIEELLYTVRNRIAAKEGRGEKRNRNKKQRRKDDE